MLRAELQLPLKKTCFWTDSTAVLRYIQNENKRFKTFVANRIHTIRENSEVDQWRYIPSGLNPADHASRGLSGGNVKQKWIETPKFLSEPENSWPQNPTTLQLPTDDPEIKHMVVACATTNSVNPTSKLIAYHSDWQKLKVAVAWFLKIKEVLLRLSKERKQISISDVPAVNLTRKLQEFKKSLGNQGLSLDNLKEAENAIIAFCQQERFSEEITALTAGKAEVSKKSSIYKLDPVFQDGFLRVGGRLSKSAIPETTKHPCILSKDQHISELIIRHVHLQLRHGGRNHVLSVIRRKYWITHGVSAVRKVLAECLFCKKYRGKLQLQQMADLPTERVVPDLPPFTNVGSSAFGGSHFGGVWERLICIIRKVLHSVLRQQVLDDEGLHTILCGAEAILNDRPLTKLSEDPNDLEALTPNHLLLMKGKPVLPPGIFEKEDLYVKRRWKQEKQKWIKRKKGLEVGDVAMVMDYTTPRGSWVLGKVLKTFPDKKGLVRVVRLQTKTNIIERPAFLTLHLDVPCTLLQYPNEPTSTSSKSSDDTRVGEIDIHA
nr:uncharacterized protein LOC129160674 [Nothobranchius furzeri]